jgi:hypothetical protein
MGSERNRIAEIGSPREIRGLDHIGIDGNCMPKILARRDRRGLNQVAALTGA